MRIVVLLLVLLSGCASVSDKSQAVVCVFCGNITVPEVAPELQE